MYSETKQAATGANPRGRGVAGANPLPRLVFLLVSFTNIEYLIYSFVLRGRRTEGVADANPLCELPRFS